MFGSDLPVEGGEAGQFVWRDGPLLKALKAGHWIVLDEVGFLRLVQHKEALISHFLKLPKKRVYF